VKRADDFTPHLTSGFITSSLLMSIVSPFDYSPLGAYICTIEGREISAKTKRRETEGDIETGENPKRQTPPRRHGREKLNRSSQEWSP